VILDSRVFIDAVNAIHGPSARIVQIAELVLRQPACQLLITASTFEAIKVKKSASSFMNRTSLLLHPMGLPSRSKQRDS